MEREQHQADRDEARRIMKANCLDGEYEPVRQMTFKREAHVALLEIVRAIAETVKHTEKSRIVIEYDPNNVNAVLTVFTEECESDWIKVP